ncbi:MAG: hypothetical protein JST14_03725 [Bacteroidetes bacterium]|nr:hypothetical protein [Bacteroidota bacterium]
MNLNDPIWNKLKGESLFLTLNGMIFFLFLALGGEFSVLMPSSDVSSVEKRTLTPLPQFSWDNLFMGHYTDSLDLHYSDNFPFRDGWVEWTARLKDNFGYRPNDLRLYTVNNEFAALDEGLNKDTFKVKTIDTLKTEIAADTIKKPIYSPGTIMIYNGMAIQIFTGSKTRAEAFAGMVNRYREQLHDSIRVFCMVAPTATDFHLPMEEKQTRNLERPMIQHVHEYLDSGIQAVDAYEEIERNISDYLYFRTDHHWTGRGAYHAYRAFCRTAGLEPADLTTFKRRVRRNYLGSLYGITKDVRLKDHQDSVESFRLPIATTLYRFPDPQLTDSVKANLFVETPNYTTFLGGDYPLIRIEADNGSTRNALVIKDSYGNAVCPFLAMHYRNVYVIDYRTFEKNILSFIQANRIHDLIFIHNTFAANAEFTAKKETYLLYAKVYRRQPEETDTTSVPGTEPRVEGNREFPGKQKP